MSDFQVTSGQEAALRVVVAFLRDAHARLARLTGYAGTGKTTLIRIIAGLAREIELPILVLAPTGKAALRVREATGEFACTIHKFLYAPRQNPETGDVTFEPKNLDELQDARGALIVVDEASMVSRKMWEHLSLAAAVVEMKILLVGDTFQLEPVQDREDKAFAPLALPTDYVAHLDEVVRQALDSPVLRAATEIRLARSPMDVSRALAHLTSLDGRTPVDVAVEHPEIPVLCHRNETRHTLNNAIRARRGLSPAGPIAGEPLLVLRNCYPIDRMNGEVVTLARWSEEGPCTSAARDRRSNEAAELTYRVGYLADERLNVLGDPTSPPAVVFCLDEVAGQSRLGEHWMEVGFRDAWRRGDIGHGLTERPQYVHANYGYSLTVHKSQGSEWDKVLIVLENSISAHTISGRRFIYTAVTRAKKQVFWTVL